MRTRPQAKMPQAHVCHMTQIGRRLYPFRWVNLLFSKFHVVLQISEELQKRFPSCSEELVEELASHLFRFVFKIHRETVSYFYIYVVLVFSLFMEYCNLCKSAGLGLMVFCIIFTNVLFSDNDPMRLKR